MIVADMRREHQAKIVEMDGAIALFRARAGEAEARYALFEQAATATIDSRLAAIRDGADGAPGRDGVDGRDADPVDMDAVAALVDRAVEARAAAAISGIERQVSERLATVRDGLDGAPGQDGKDGEPGRDGSDGRDGIDGNPGRDGSDGKDADEDAILARLMEPVAAKLAECADAESRLAASIAEAKASIDARLVELKDGRDGADGRDADPVDMDAVAALVTTAVEARTLPVLADVERQVADRLATVRDGRDGVDGKDGRMPVAKAWSDGVQYAGAIVTHAGATWQARQDTGREPPHSDWICLAAAGADARGFTHAGTWAEAGEYRANDVVMLNGSTFLALRDAPGPCPGDGWQLWASRGSKGPAGDRGPRGEKGDGGRDAAEVVGFYRDGDAITMTFADGREMRA